MAAARPASSSPTTSSAAAATATSQPGAKVSANTASETDIASALSTAGVSNAERWAKEVVEYRPYPADDPNMTKLRDNLAKYNPGSGDRRQDRLGAHAVTEIRNQRGPVGVALVRRGLYGALTGDWQ